MFLHFLQKYRCVPKIGFSADISIDVSIDIFIDIYIDILIDVSIDIYIEILTDIFIYIFIDISIDILDWQGGRKEKEGVDLFLKSNDPTPEGGEKQSYVLLGFAMLC